MKKELLFSLLGIWFFFAQTATAQYHDPGFVEKIDGIYQRYVYTPNETIYAKTKLGWFFRNLAKKVGLKRSETFRSKRTYVRSLIAAKVPINEDSAWLPDRRTKVFQYSNGEVFYMRSYLYRLGDNELRTMFVQYNKEQMEKFLDSFELEIPMPVFENRLHGVMRGLIRRKGKKKEHVAGLILAVNVLPENKEYLQELVAKSGIAVSRKEK